jgi:peptide/nickel transport system permease protein
MILPVIPICITLYLASANSIWLILGVMVILNIIGSAIRNYRAIFLHVKKEPHIEAARAYGAGDRRIILRYLVPRIIPVLIPQLIILVPSYVFLEAMRAYLGVSDPTLPTWAKLIEPGISHGLYTGAYHTLLEPLGLLLLLSFAFVMFSLALERTFQ